jgi:3-hydroxybutyrate dehydrogenase
VFLTFREALGQFRGWGRLIAVASTAGLKGYAKVAPYAAAKHGVVGLVRSLALEVARKPITVNAICRGFLDTPMTEHSVQVIAEKTGKTLDEARAALEGLNPQGRLIQPSEVTAAALYLVRGGSGHQRPGLTDRRGRGMSEGSKRRLKMWIRLLGVTRSAENQLREYLR